LFKAIPARPNLAFVVVQHLSPDQPSQLAALLGNWTPLCVREAGVRGACRVGVVLANA
jgi:two-component system CheB/CheR fusion protein